MLPCLLLSPYPWSTLSVCGSSVAPFMSVFLSSMSESSLSLPLSVCLSINHLRAYPPSQELLQGLGL